MSKSILLSIRSEWVEKILNGEKTIEVRKQFPKDYVGWVYIYCTKDSKNILCRYYDIHWFTTKDKNNNWKMYMNGKVVARFWCDKVEEITTEKWSPSKEQNLLKESCLTENQLFDYCNLESGKPFYAIHISKLEIFDKPKYLNEYYKAYIETEKGIYYQVLTKAPQNYCYIEGEKIIAI